MGRLGSRGRDIEQRATMSLLLPIPIHCVDPRLLRNRRPLPIVIYVPGVTPQSDGNNMTFSFSMAKVAVQGGLGGMRKPVPFFVRSSL